MPHFGRRGAGAASPHTPRGARPGRPSARAGRGRCPSTQSTDSHTGHRPEHRHPHGHRPMPGRGHSRSRSRRPKTPAPSRSCRWCLALSAAAWQGPRSATLRCAMAPRRPGARRVRAGAGLGGTGSRGEQEAGPAAPRAAGRRSRRRRRDRPLLLSSPHRVAAALPPPPPHGACAFLGALRLCCGAREHVLGSTSLKCGGGLVPVNTVTPAVGVP